MSERPGKMDISGRTQWRKKDLIFNSASVKYHACSLFLQQSDIHWLNVMCGRTFLLGLVITSDVNTITICDRQFRLFWNNPSTKFRNRMVINIQFWANCAVFVDKSACCNRCSVYRYSFRHASFNTKIKLR